MTVATKTNAWLRTLARISDEPPRLTRTFLSPAMRRANAQVASWMRAEGLSVREDAVGNLIGRLASPRAEARTLLLGSHLDTVRDAGRFDGPLGVLLPVAVLGELRRRGRALPYHVEVIGFSEEEGVRFRSAYLGSKGFTGTLRASDLARSDEAGVTVRHALEAFTGRPFVPPRPAHRRRALLGYLEVHIEQGPVLESEGHSVGVVSAIAGQTRGSVIFRGRAGHAGTTPMALRRDALAGGAEWILAAEALARRSPPLVVTVGAAAVRPGAPNVIPGEALLSFDVRHPRDAARRRALLALQAEARRVAGRRGLGCDWDVSQDGDAVACAPALTRVAKAAVQEVQGACPALVSGAGHDAVVVSQLTPVAMLFVRCRGGVSHHPDEFASVADIGVAGRVLTETLVRLAEHHS